MTSFAQLNRGFTGHAEHFGLVYWQLVMIMQVLHRCNLLDFKTVSVSSLSSISVVVTEESTSGGKSVWEVVTDDNACCTLVRQTM